MYFDHLHLLPSLIPKVFEFLRQFSFIAQGWPRTHDYPFPLSFKCQAFVEYIEGMF